MTVPKRIQLSRRKGWRKPENAVVVSRPTRWGNPWVVGSPGRLDMKWTSMLLPRDLDRADAAEQFGVWIAGYAIPHDMRPDNLTRAGRREIWDHLALRRHWIFDHIGDLRGKDLACWCPLHEPCHANTLLWLANR